MDNIEKMDIQDLIAYLDSGSATVTEVQAIQAYLQNKQGDYIIPFINPATNDELGVVKPDGTSITVSEDGTISAISGGSGASGTSRKVGDIGLALYVDETKGLQRVLNGSIVSINENTQALLNYLKELQPTNPDLFTTEENWQAEAALNTEGLCGKFVIDEEEGTIRLPKYPKYILGQSTTTTVPVVGTNVTLGITDGNKDYSFQRGNSASSLYAVTYSDTTLPATGPDSGFPSAKALLGVSTDPEHSGLIADISNLNTKLELQYFIQIATDAAEVVDIKNEIELNNPFTLFETKYTEEELYNISWSKGGSILSKAVYPSAYEALLIELNTSIEVGTKTETGYIKRGLPVKNSSEDGISEYDFVVYQDSEEFRLPSKIKMMPLGGTVPVVGNGNILTWIDKNGVEYGTEYVTGSWSGMLGSTYNANMPIDSPAVPTGGRPANQANLGITTVSGHSGLIADLSLAENENAKLYFYVGETVQNANLIDAGRLAEQISDFVHLIDSYQNGTSWYRVYSDGWCEQGGYWTRSAASDTITLLKEYKDTNYSIFTQLGHTATSTDGRPPLITIGSIATDSFVWNEYTSYDGCFWEAKGYLAQGEY